MFQGAIQADITVTAHSEHRSSNNALIFSGCSLLDVGLSSLAHSLVPLASPALHANCTAA